MVEAGLDVEAVLERVAVETVVLAPPDGETEAEAEAEAAEVMLAITEEADALMLETAAEAEEAAAEADETALDPPVRGNWPE